MKKILIPAFFVGTILLTYLVAKATTSIRLNEKDVLFKTYTNSLSDNEVAAMNEAHRFATPLPTEHARVEECYDVKETRTKGFFGWELKVDTLKSYVNIIRADNNQH
jgi:hypothetical protein